ncbi:MAG: AAA family ATPase [Bacteroidetes bacterium]|nr:AAA family ATPase [Bacteroidota bacterium]
MNFAEQILAQFPFEPTDPQRRVVQRLAEFVTDPDPQRVFLLRGYAGTGKTSLVSALVNALPSIRRRCILLAPTGRAAKVLSGYSGQTAWTIHKKIYRPSVSADEGFFALQSNPHRNTLFIVDEASMIGEGGAEKGFTKQSLLDDLMQYVYGGDNCRLLLVGDTAQLPPVGLLHSPALDPEFLKRAYALPVGAFELREVVRQGQESGVLYNATKLRIDIAQGEKSVQPKFELQGYKDVIRIQGGDLLDALEDAYRTYGAEDTIVICRSNKRANLYNQQIRARIRWQEDEISAGDHLMVVKNNYMWLPDESKAGFIANGDAAVIQRIRKYREMHGFRFADVVLQLTDYPEEPELEARIMLDTLHTEAPALTSPQQAQLYESVAEDYLHLPTKRDRYLGMKADPWLNALQVKFGYAVTCHKAQGGQWKAVFIEQGYLTDEMVNQDFLRWLYTALTRTTEKVYLINFNEAFYA